MPCAHCVKRKCQDLCPHGYRKTAKRLARIHALLPSGPRLTASTTIEQLKEMQQQVKLLQQTLQSNGISLPTAASAEEADQGADEGGSTAETEGSDSDSESSRTGTPQPARVIAARASPPSASAPDNRQSAGPLLSFPGAAGPCRAQSRDIGPFPGRSVKVPRTVGSERMAQRCEYRWANLQTHTNDVARGTRDRRSRVCPSQ